MLIELSKHPFNAVNCLLKQRRLACRKAKGCRFHCFRKCRAIAQFLDEREYELAYDAIHFLGRLVLKAAPTKFFSRDFRTIGIAVSFRKNTRLRHTQHLLHTLSFKFFFVKRANEHKVGKLANNLNGVGNATLPHLLPNGVDLTLSCSSDHGYLPFSAGSLSAQAH